MMSFKKKSPRVKVPKKAIWKPFLRLLGKVNIPWHWVILSLVISLAGTRLSIYFFQYQQVLIDGSFQGGYAADESMDGAYSDEQGPDGAYAGELGPDGAPLEPSGPEGTAPDAPGMDTSELAPPGMDNAEQDMPDEMGPESGTPGMEAAPGEEGAPAEGEVPPEGGEGYPGDPSAMPGGEASSDMTTRVWTAIGILAAMTVVALFNNYFSGWLRNRISRGFRDSVWNKSVSLPIEAFEGMNPKEIISRTVNDTSMIGDSIVTLLSTLITVPFSLSVSIMAIYQVNPTLAYAQMIVVPLFLIEKFIYGRISFRLSYKLQFRLASLTEVLAELLRNIPLIKIFTREKEEIQRGDVYIEELNRISLKSEMIGLVFTIIDQLLELFTRLFAVIYGAYLIHQGAITTGAWVTFFGLVSNIFFDFNQIMTQWPLIKSIQGAVERVAQILDLPDERIDGEDVKNAFAPFMYDRVTVQLGDKDILKDISLTIPRGKKIAIVGASGAGKTTLLNTLERFYTPKEGEILLGEQNINDTHMHQYRSLFSYVPQDVQMFSNTLRYNLTYGVKGEVSDEDILAACRAAHIESFIKKQPEGLNTFIAEAGSNLSGGERQRIGIARAILQNAGVVLLDEATANMDAESEYHVLQAINALTEGRTLIMVAHRLDLVKDADKIIVLDHGCVEGTGTHEELSETCEAYKELLHLAKAEA